MLRSRNNRREKRTLRKRNKRELKNKRTRTKKNKKNKKQNKKNKKTQKKKRINLQIGGNVEPMMARVLHTLERDVIEYLPSTKVIDSLHSEGHYIEMVDYLKLQEIINDNENFKKSPKIRKLFDYDLYEINDKDMYFVYKDFKCENIFKDVDKYYIYILYFYLMECNITKNDKIQQDGGAQIENKPPEDSGPDDIPSDPTPEGYAAPTPEGDAAPTPEGDAVPTPEGDAVPTPEGEGAPTPEGDATPTPEGDAAPTPEGEGAPTPGESSPDDSPSEPTPDVEDNNEKEVEVPEENKENEGLDEVINLADEIELPGFEEYEQTRRKLDMQSSVVNGNIKITNSDLIKYKVNWFNICMGIDIFDTGFENKVASKLDELGIKPFKRDKLLEKLTIILEDTEMTSSFKNAIYERLMENCKEPEKFIYDKKKCEKTMENAMDKILGMFRKCHEKEMKDKGAILYLHDKYRSILNRNRTTINNVDMILILLNCEIRQRILSYHISVEIIRRRNSNNNVVKSILENIYNIDKPIIRQVEDELRNKIAQERIEREKLVKEVNREEIEMRKKQMMKERNPELIQAINKKQEEEQIDKNLNLSKEEKEEVEKVSAINTNNNDKFIEQHNNLLKMDNNVVGGGFFGGSENNAELNLESDILEKGEKKNNNENGGFDIYNQNIVNEVCNKVRNTNTITKDDLLKGPILNKCPNF